MKENTFSITVNIIEDIPNFEKMIEGVPTIEQVKTQKTLTFKKLDQRDQDQHELHFMIMSHYTSGSVKKKGKNKVVVEHTFALDVVREFMETMIVYNEEFKMADAGQVTTDSGALMQLTRTLIPDHVIPFFLQLMTSMT